MEGYDEPRSGRPVVDAHTEGDRCADDIGLITFERLLVPISFIPLKTGMVWESPIPILLETVCNLLGLFSAHAVDDTRCARVAFNDVGDLVERLL